MPHHSIRAFRVTRPVRMILSVVSSCGTARSGTCVVTQHHPQLFGGEHHGDFDVAREMRQPLGVPRPPESGQVERVLVGGRRNDGVGLATQRQLHPRLRSLPPVIRPARTARVGPGQSAGPSSPDPSAQLPTAIRRARGDIGYLLLGADNP